MSGGVPNLTEPKNGKDGALMEEYRREEGGGARRGAEEEVDGAPLRGVSSSQ